MLFIQGEFIVLKYITDIQSLTVEIHRRPVAVRPFCHKWVNGLSGLRWFEWTVSVHRGVFYSSILFDEKNERNRRFTLQWSEIPIHSAHLEHSPIYAEMGAQLLDGDVSWPGLYILRQKKDRSAIHSNVFSTTSCAYVRFLCVLTKASGKCGQMWPKCGQNVVKMWPKCGQNVFKMWPKCTASFCPSFFNQTGKTSATHRQWNWAKKAWLNRNVSLSENVVITAINTLDCAQSSDLVVDFALYFANTMAMTWKFIVCTSNSAVLWLSDAGHNKINLAVLRTVWRWEKRSAVAQCQVPLDPVTLGTMQRQSAALWLHSAARCMFQVSPVAPGGSPKRGGVRSKKVKGPLFDSEGAEKFCQGGGEYCLFFVRSKFKGGAKAPWPQWSRRHWVSLFITWLI